jgi:hypothetical protein
MVHHLAEEHNSALRPPESLLVVYRMDSLASTVLQQLLGPPTAPSTRTPEGTWIRDVATYMMQQSTRPGRDLVMVSRGPPLASAVVAAAPLEAAGPGRGTSGSAAQLTAKGGPPSSSAAPPQRAPPGASAPEGAAAPPLPPQQPAAAPCSVGMYLISAMVLEPLQLQVGLCVTMIVDVLMVRRTLCGGTGLAF